MTDMHIHCTYIGCVLMRANLQMTRNICIVYICHQEGNGLMNFVSSETPQGVEPSRRLTPIRMQGELC